MRRRLITAVFLPAFLLLAACAGGAPTADWKTGKDVLDGLKSAGFACDDDPGSSEQVITEGSLTAVDCDTFAVVLIASKDAFIKQLFADPAACEPMTEEEMTQPIVFSDTFVVYGQEQDNAFPAAAQPADFIKAFGGEELNVSDLQKLGCPDS